MATLSNGHKHSEPENGAYTIRLSARFLVMTALSCCALGVGVGRLCRSFLVPYSTTRTTSSSRLLFPLNLPHVELPGHKLPRAVYTSKQFESSHGSMGNSILARRSLEEDGTTAIDGTLESLESIQNDSSSSEPVYQPSGQHLLMDILLLDPAALKEGRVLLQSQAWVAHAILELIQSSGLTLLSYHCHDVQPTGVSCLGVLLESHVSVRTWPTEGVLVLDLFTCGEGDLRPLIPTIHDLFVIQPSHNVSGVEPRIQWAYKKRGFPYEDEENEQDPNQIGEQGWLVGSMDYELKQQVAQVQTKYQQVLIYSALQPRFRTLENYHRSLSNDGSYYAQQAELFQPDRIVYLDNIMQSRLYGEAAYHEALVHPSIFAHENPKRVAIIGGGEGATLREALKHKTVERVTMLEIDEQMVNVSRTFLPEWSDCSNIHGSAKSCFEDPRADVVYTDAIAWFIERFGGGKQIAEEDKYDVIIMDALDPNSVVSFSDILYQNNEYVSAIYNGLTRSGIFISQIGEDDFFNNAPDSYSPSGKPLIKFAQLLQAEGFQIMKRYSEAHGNFLAAWAFMVMWKDAQSAERWFASQAMIDLNIQKRILPTIDGREPLKFFDGATMMSYQYPSRVNQEVFCRESPSPRFCDDGHGLDPRLPNAPASYLNVQKSNISHAGLGVFAREMIPVNAYIAAEEAAHSLVVQSPQWRLLEAFENEYNSMKDYISHFGHSNDLYGGTAFAAHMPVLAFLNHGCNREFAIGQSDSTDEMAADPKHFQSDAVSLSRSLQSIFNNPFVDRNQAVLLNAAITTSRNIEVDLEVLDNYLRYLQADNWEQGIHRLGQQCSA